MAQFDRHHGSLRCYNLRSFVFNIKLFIRFLLVFVLESCGGIPKLCGISNWCSTFNKWTPHWLRRCHNLPQPATTHHNVLWWDVVRCGELWRAYHNLPQKRAPSCGELWHPQLEPTICHNSPQSIHILPQLNHILPQLNHTLPHLTTIHSWFITIRIDLIRYRYPFQYY